MKKILLFLIPVLFIGCASMGDFSANANFGESYKAAEYSNIKSEYDKYRNITFYYTKRSKSFDPIHLYIGKDEYNKYLRCKVYYSGKDWIFFDKIYLINKENKRFITDVYFYNKNTDVRDGHVYESIDFVIKNDEIEDFLELLNGTSISMKLSGTRSKEYKIKERNVKAMKEIIDFYNQL